MGVKNGDRNRRIFTGAVFGDVRDEPSMTHSCESSRARGVLESPRVVLPHDPAHLN